MDEIGASELRIGPEIAALGNCAPVQGDEARSELAGVEDSFDVPVGGDDESDPGSLALDDEARGHGLNAPGGKALRDLLPKNGRDLVPIQTVEDPARLLGVDQPAVYVPGLLEGALDRIRGDLVEDHAAHRNLRLQHLDEVPRDRLALTIFVRREQELVRFGEPLLQARDHVLLVGIDDVEGLEVFLRVHAEPRPRHLLHVRRDVGGALRQVADVSDARLDDEARPEVAGDRPRFRGRLDDDETALAVLRCWLCIRRHCETR